MRVPWNRGGLRTYLLLVGLLAGYATPASIAVGTPFLLAGIALHLWAKGCLHQNREVTASGPYRLVRHPFYVANAFLDLGFGLMSGWWLLVALLPAWWLTIYVPTMRHEEADMLELFGDAYAAYRKRVPLFIPYRRPIPAGAGGFSWSNPNLANTEVPRTFRFLSYPLLFVISYRLHSRGIGLLRAPSLFDVLTLAGCACVLLTGKALRQHFKRRRPILPAWIIEDRSRAAILLAAILTGMVVTSFEVESGWAIWPTGIALLAVSAATRGAGLQQPAISEALLAIGLAVLFELMWFALLLIPFYLAIVLDQRLSTVRGERKTIDRQSFRAPPVTTYSLALVAGVALSVLKDVWF